MSKQQQIAAANCMDQQMEKLNIATTPIQNDISFGGSQNGIDKKNDEDDFNEVTS